MCQGADKAYRGGGVYQQLKTMVRNLNPKKALSLIFYIGAAAGAFVFLKDVFDEYSEGKSSFHTSYKDILAEDIPTITFCYWPYMHEHEPDTKPEYGLDIQLHYR